ncbi:HAMP domain-containing protein [bacterium]|nr:MAG: HAMP domain-containing protein [bacterium]
MTRPTELIAKRNRPQKADRRGKSKGLFWKIFGGFLLTQLLLSAVTFGVTFANMQRLKANSWRDISLETFTSQADRLASLIDSNKGQIQTPQARDFLKDLRTSGILLSIYDDKGALLLGNPLPTPVQRLRQQVLDSAAPSLQATSLSSQDATRIDSPQLEVVDDTILGASLLLAPNGHRYVLAMQMPRVELRVLGGESPRTIVLYELKNAEMLPAATLSARTMPAQSVGTFAPSSVDKYSVTSPLVRTAPSVELSIAQPAGTVSSVDFVTDRTFSPLNLSEEDIIRTVTLFLVAGAVCYVLALYLAAPVEALRSATEKLATGDLTARVGPRLGRRRDELADLGHDFDHMAQRLETSMTSQRRLLTDISHELRSPLARLAVALDLAQQDAGAKAQPSLKRIDTEANRMGELISHLLTWTKLENGLDGIIEERFDLAAMLREIAADAGFEAQTKNAEVHLDSPPEIWIKGARSLLQRALENPVRNAVRYTRPQTSVHIKVSPSYHPNLLTIVVQDQGPGVPQESLDHLFEPFYRVEGARDESGGVGLGLSITQRAIESHGGQVQISNAQNSGLQVQIQLPFAS